MRWESPEDQVKRKHRFQTGHPEWHFISPLEPRSVLRRETDWRAVGPGGDVIRGTDLRDLLDQLDKLVTE
jgi:hypothetical protein